MPPISSGWLHDAAGRSVKSNSHCTSEDECAVDHAQCSHHVCRPTVTGQAKCLGVLCVSLLLSGILAQTGAPSIGASSLFLTYSATSIRLRLCSSSEMVIRTLIYSKTPLSRIISSESQTGSLRLLYWPSRKTNCSIPQSVLELVIHQS